MRCKAIAVISSGESDLLDILNASGLKVTLIKPDEVNLHDLDDFEAVAVLGGTGEKPLVLHPRDRIAIEGQLKKGKHIFCEFCGSISDYYYPEPVSTRFERLVFCGAGEAGAAEEKSAAGGTETAGAEDDGGASGIAGGIEGLEVGDLLDDQCNTAMKPYSGLCSKSIPVLQYVNPNDHSHMEVKLEVYENISNRALWFEREKNLLVCSFRMCNFIKARFAPRKRWRSLVGWLLKWLCSGEIDVNAIPDAYSCIPCSENKPFEKQVGDCIAGAMDWFKSSGILLKNGKDGILEGIATEIYPDGSQRILSDIRNDCTGEASLAYFMYYMLTGEKESLEISDSLISVCFDMLQDKSDSHLKGMLRWSKTQWGVCYQDDAARVLIPQLLKCLYTGRKDYLGECVDALKFLVRTTGIDGTRVRRTDNIRLTPQEVERLASTPGNFPSGHFNGFYLGALLLAYKLTGIEEFRQVGIKGMETIMAAYPDTEREHSETQELCRLILPLSWLYWVTGDEKHREWLYGVTADLARFSHPSGGFLEWDTGYKAFRSVANKGDECSLLARNGDPVTDLLYSMNWLPIGFAQAYFVTGDRYFEELWHDVARFMITTQIHSGNPQINGAWARAFDVDIMEVFGMPKDAGWGPCVIESGWTVAEIAAGLAMGLLSEQLRTRYI